MGHPVRTDPQDPPCLCCLEMMYQANLPRVSDVVWFECGDRVLFGLGFEAKFTATIVEKRLDFSWWRRY